MLPPKKRQENRQSQEVSDPIPDPPAGDHLDDVQEPLPDPSDDTLSDSSSGSSLEPGSESQMFHRDSPPSPRGTQHLLDSSLPLLNHHLIYKISFIELMS